MLIRNAWSLLFRERIRNVLGERNVIIPVDILLSKGPEVQDDARIGSGSDFNIRERITANLDMILVLIIVPNRELRFRVIEWDRERIVGVFGIVNFNRFR